jgi:hypothetical protein
MNESQYARAGIEYECSKHRMTYERAGLMFRAMKLNVKACAEVCIQEVLDMGLVLPDTLNPTFAEFLDYNADRLQLFDEHPTIQLKYENPTTYICIYLNDLDK